METVFLLEEEDSAREGGRLAKGVDNAAVRVERPTVRADDQVAAALFQGEFSFCDFFYFFCELLSSINAAILGFLFLFRAFIGQM